MISLLGHALAILPYAAIFLAGLYVLREWWLDRDAVSRLNALIERDRGR